MRVLLINNLGRLHSGAEIMAGELKADLLAQGHTAMLLSGDEPASGEKMSDAEFRSFSDRSLLRILWFIINPSALRLLSRTLKDFQPDVVHLHNTSKASPLILRLLRDYPTVLTIHDHLAFDPTRIGDMPTLVPYRQALSGYFIGRLNPRYLWEKLHFGLYRRYAKNIDLVITPSDFYRRAAEESCIYRQVQTIPNGIPLPAQVAYPEKSGTTNLLYAGRLDEIKGVDVLIRAFAQARHKDARLELTICGGGAGATALQALVRELGMSSHVHFKNFVSHQKLDEIYTHTHIVLIPSKYPDNLPTVCIEAMARGRGVIASNIGGIPEMVESGRTGLLVAPGNASELAAAILTLAGDPALTRSMGRHGRQVAEAKFSSPQYLKSTISAYNSLIAP